MEEQLKENYRKFITGGALYICTLLAERKPAQWDEDGFNAISWQQLLQLHEAEGDARWMQQLLEYFTCPQQIRFFYESLVEAAFYLRHVDLGASGRKRADYQSLYPDLILQTYGRGRALSAAFSYDSTKGAGTVRYDRIRKTAVNILIEEIIAKNGAGRYVDYDFESQQAKEVLQEMLLRVEKAQEEEALKQTKKIFRRICRQDLSEKLEEPLAMLIDSVEENPVPDIKDLKRLDTKVITEGESRSRCVITAEEEKGGGAYLLFIDGAVQDVSRRPFFDKKYLRTDSRGKSVYRSLLPGDLTGREVGIFRAAGAKVLKTEVFSEDGYDVANAKEQARCSSYTLRVDGAELYTGKKPYFKIFEEGAFFGHRVEILANRNFDDLYLILEAGRKYALRNFLLEFTDPKRNALTNSYSILLLAWGSLEALERISPETHQKIMDVISAKKNANLKSLWPLACIFSF